MPNVINITTAGSSYCRAVCPGVCDEQCICDTHSGCIHQMQLGVFTYAHMHTLAHLADSKSVHRVWDKALHVEVEWTVGPIPIDDKKGKEVVLRYASSLHSGQTCLLISCASPGFEA